MTILAEQLAKKLTKGMSLPKPFELLYSWIENNGLYVDTEDRRVGFLYPDEKMRSAWTETERPGGTKIEFTAIGNDGVKYRCCWWATDMDAWELEDLIKPLANHEDEDIRDAASAFIERPGGLFSRKPPRAASGPPAKAFNW